MDDTFLAHEYHVDSMGRYHINRKEIPIGSVVYYLKGTKVPHQKEVGYGIVEEHYVDCVVLQLIEPKDIREIDGVPIKDFTFPTRWQKLPKGWTWDTKFFDCPLAYTPKIYAFDWTNPEDILREYEAGNLVNVQENDHSIINAEINEKYGWRIKREYNPFDYHPSYMTVDYRNVYTDAKDAIAAKEAYEAELKRQSELSEYDWSVEQIDRVLDHWAMIESISDVEKQKYRDWLLARDKVEDIELRISEGAIQWKYWKNKRWQNIEP